MPEIKNPQLRQLYEYWDGKRAGRAMPARADLDPIEMRFAIGNMILVDVIDGDPLRFHFRLHGTNLAERVRYDLTGKMLDDMPLPEFRNLTQMSFSKVAHTKEVIHAQRDEVLDNLRRSYETLILPLSSDGERVDMILCALFYSHLDT